MKRTILATILILTVSFGMLVASAAVKKREFSGTAKVQICTKEATGKWQIVDELTAAGLTFQFSVADITGEKPLSTDFGFSGRTAKGLSVSARLKKGATGSSDLTKGLVDMSLPLELTVNGKKSEAIFKFTTESAQGALGNVSGRRAVIDTNARTAKLGMVSGTVIKDPALARVVVNHEEQIAVKAVDQKAEQKLADNSLQKRPPEIADQVLVVIVGDGTLRAL